MSTQKSFSFWWIWLVVVSIIIMSFGLSMVLLPGPLRQFFSLALFGNALKLSAFDKPALTYVTLIHGVLGAAMFGWGACLISILFDSFRQLKRSGWWGIAASIAAWYIPDTFISLQTGFWPNAALNTGFVILFLLPLAATYRAFHD